MDDQMHAEQDKIDISDIARGRRITAVAASEMSMTPRQMSRPRASTGLTRYLRKLKFRLQSVKYDD